MLARWQAVLCFGDCGFYDGGNGRDCCEMAMLMAKAKIIIMVVMLLMALIT